MILKRKFVVKSEKNILSWGKSDRSKSILGQLPGNVYNNLALMYLKMCDKQGK